MMRINKYLSEHGACSRRQADTYITEGRVKINDRIAVLGDIVLDTDLVWLDNTEVKRQKPFVYFMFNKPVGITSTTDPKIKDNVVDFIQYPDRIFHVGRLDKDSSGLLLMTDDGNIVNKILRSEFEHEKEYVVRVNKDITEAFLNGMRSGVPILNTTTKPCIIKALDARTFSIIITEGMNRQIRRMCDYFSYQVITLKRIRLINLTLDIPVGHMRALTHQEKSELFKLIDYKILS